MTHQKKRRTELIITTAIILGGMLALADLLSKDATGTAGIALATVMCSLAVFSVVNLTRCTSRSLIGGLLVVIAFVCWTASTRVPATSRASFLAWAPVLFGVGATAVLATVLPLLPAKNPHNREQPHNQPAEGSRSLPGNGPIVNESENEPFPADVGTAAPSLTNDIDDTLNGHPPILQTWTRLRSDDSEQLEGMIHIEFEKGQRVARQHIPLVPQFESTPNAWCECSDDIFAAEFDHVYSYGARLTVRRRGEIDDVAATDVSIVLEGRRPVQRAA